VTSHRCCQAVTSARRVWNAHLRTRVVVTLAALAVGLGTTQFATAFWQVPEEPSPASGTAQVIAQGVVDIQDNDVRWQITQGTAPPPADATESRSDLGFLLVDSGVLLAEDVATREQHRLPAGEAMLTRSDEEQVRAAVGSEPPVYHILALVDADGTAPADDNLPFASEPFSGPGARHDMDLLRDALGPAGTMTIPAGAAPTLVLVLDGVADVAGEDGDVFSLGEGEAVSLTGPIVVTAAENGATVTAAYIGPAVPQLAESVATPVPGQRVIESSGTPTSEPAEALPAATATARQSATDDADDDEDGLTNAAEDEAGTDPNLADTDEDGLTDGEESAETGTSPLSADTDSDGVLDGDEVAQGTDPLDGIAAVATEETAAPDEGTAEEPAPASAVTAPGDSDGDGLEDAIEVELGTDPVDLDTDDDGLTDGDEYYVHQTGTRNPDSDGDGVVDGDEATNGTDPNDPASF
jgi:Bacterial TSP3 repeat